MHVSSVLEEQLNDADSVVTSSQVEGGGLQEKAACYHTHPHTVTYNRLASCLCAAFNATGASS